MAQLFRAPLDAIAGTVPVGAVQSATIVSEISSKLVRWIATKQPATLVVPRMQDVSVLQGGSVWWYRGQAVAPGRAVPALGALLASLLDRTAAHRTPAGLLYVVARATDPGHLAPFVDLAEFHHTLARYAASRPSPALDALVARYAVACSGFPPLGTESSISDVRRLRRAGGVALTQIAADTAIPISLLRELEWGVYTHWKLEHARGALDRYAERAGLDADAVARVVEQEQAAMVAVGVRHEGSLEEFNTGAQQEGSARRCQSALASSVNDRRVVPYALAGMLVSAVLLAAPGDRSAPEPRAVTSAAVVPATDPSYPAQSVSVSNQPAARAVERQVTPATNRVPRAGRPATSGAPRKTTATRSRPRHPLAKLARAIAGNGEYKVEPFPRVQEKQ